MGTRKSNLNALAEVPVSGLHGVGPRIAAALRRLRVFNLCDLLLHLPVRYQDRTRVRTIFALRSCAEATIEARIVQTSVATRGRRHLRCLVEDDTGQCVLIFFHFTAAQRKSLRPGSRLRCFGEIRSGPGELCMIHPDYQFIRTGIGAEGEQHLTPIYPVTKGLSQARIRGLMERALGSLRATAVDPTDVLFAGKGLPSLCEALFLLHRPPGHEDIGLLNGGRHPARLRLAEEELLTQQLAMLRLRQQSKSEAAIRLALPQRDRDAFLERLPFRPTDAQMRAIVEVLHDLDRPHLMLRLLQGDVGSGKTLVAGVAALAATALQFQAALLAPTEILARQHARTMLEWGLPVELLTGKSNRRQRHQVLGRLARGEGVLVVGTHALFQCEVVFARLALVIVDEQHRFGVSQRLAMHEKGESQGQSPHRLIMTATPIPRTLALSFYMDMDYSLLDELPPGRKPTKTVVLPGDRGRKVLTRLGVACRAGQQAYWVCPLIETSATLEIAAAEDVVKRIATVLPDVSVGLLHGRMKSADKDSVMQDFLAGRLQVLVATTVVEVGVDAPNAAIMVIENAERLGLAQLHQLRGRVGRGGQNGACVLLYEPPLSAVARQRLEVMRTTTDGFRIAERDLELRGPGEFLGVRQTGTPEFRIADLALDGASLEELGGLAKSIHDPDLVDVLMQRWVPEGERLVEA